jgi:hypothetical protein
MIWTFPYINESSIFYRFGSNLEEDAVMLMGHAHTLKSQLGHCFHAAEIVALTRLFMGKCV